MAKRACNSDNESKKKKSRPNDDSMNDPDLQVYTDDLIVIIKDKYPKANFHYLVLPKEEISNLKKLSKDHIKLLEHMETVAEKITKEDQHKNVKFKLGYHAEASMYRLHMHIISDDMNSPCLKTKKHWNTFTTNFFIHPKVILEDIKKYGKVKILSTEKCKEYMNAPLKCHKCDVQPKNIPKLKEHILSHMK